MKMDDDEPVAVPEPVVGHARRNVLIGAGVSAAVVGLGAALWQRREEPAMAVPPVEGFWELRWDTPGGTKLAMETFRGKPLLLNFWATWCAPCIEELPLIKKKEFGLSFSRSPAGAILQGEVDPGKIINHPRAGAGFAAFILKAVANEAAQL